MESRQSSFISMEEEMQPLHVMLVPWLSYSHIAAFLELAKKLGTHGLRVSFLSSPLNIRWIRQHHLIPEIELLEIPLLSMDGLPEGVESTADLKRGDTFDLLMEAMDGWEKPFEDLLGRISPDFMAAALPQGFVERTQGRGLLVTEWVPQLHILSHSAVGAFLTHCGWNSVTEGLRFGVPLVTFPLQHEQSLNAKLIAQELKLGVEVRRNDEDDSFSKQDVSKAVCTLMVEEEGRYIRSHVQEIGGVLTKNNRQIQGSNIHHFISLMKKEKAACKAAKQAMLDSDASGQLETELAISGMQLEFLERDSKLVF
ncbi:hypothetical protein SUGI_1129040 [Cryptomeria japonica]|nr:hypothetical protein SUGI_1129040 [Cryptomeria japonica]